MRNAARHVPRPGEAFAWEEKLKELLETRDHKRADGLLGDPELVKRIWQDVDALAYIYVWHCLLSF